MTRRGAIADAVAIAEIATVAGLAIALGNLRLLSMPLGGSISLAFLPLVVFALARGMRPCLIAGAVAGIGHALAGGVIIHPVQGVLDYVAAPMLVSLAALAPGRGRSRAYAGAAIAGLVSLTCYTLSGVVFFADALGNDAALEVALVRNAATVVPETVIVALLAPLALDAWRRATPWSVEEPAFLRGK
jgi:thiamine transporter